MTDERPNHFRRLWDLGYHRLTPIVPPGAPLSERSSLFKRLNAKNADDARGKVPGVKWSDGTWSGFDFVTHESNEADLDRWHNMGAGVGIKTGDGLGLIDADTWHEDRALIIRDIIKNGLGFLPPVRVGQYPKAGYLIRTTAPYLRIEFGERDERGRLKERVEILGDGRQFVAEGIHPKTGKPYRWPKGLPPLKDIPEVTLGQLERILRRCAEALPSASALIMEGNGTSDVDQTTLRGSMETLRMAVGAISNTSEQFPSRESYRDFGYAIKAAAGPEHEAEALEIFLDWCARWVDGENDLDVARADWGRMKGPFRRGISWLCELAGMTGAATADRWFDATDPGKSLFPVEHVLNATAKAKRFSFTSFGHAASTALESVARALIKGVQDQGAMTVLYGESNAGKTFVAMDMAYHVARGLPWAGRRTAGLPVLYVAAEGGQGAKKRAAALAAKHGACDAFHFLLHPINLLRADADLVPLIESIRDCGAAFGLVVIDTLSRAMAGGDENASTDMGAMVKHLDALRHATGAHIMIVHHSGKDRAKGARGHSLLRAATDTEIEVADREIVVTKQRDLDGAFASGFVLDVVTLGVDSDGDPVTSCTVRLVSVAEAKADSGGLTSRERDVLSAFDGDAELSVDDIFDDDAGNENRMTVSAIRATLKRLVNKKLLVKSSHGMWKKVAKTALATLANDIRENDEVAKSGQRHAATLFD